MKVSDGFFEGVGGLRLYYRAWEVAQPRSAIVVVHGLGEHGGRYQALAQTLGAYGFSTFALDLRGHGLSDGRRGHVRRFEAFLQDVDRFRREVQGLVDVGVPLFLLGHSMGGLIALRYLEEFDTPFRGGVIVSPWLATAMPVPRWKVTLAGALNRVLPAIPIHSRLNMDDLSRDPAVVREYHDDPLVHSFVTPRLFSEASIAMGLVLQRSDRIHVPLMFILAGGDRIVATPRSEAFARSLSARDVAIHVYPEAYHEVFNDLDRSLAITDLRNWIATRLATAMPKRQQFQASALHQHLS
jgi:alpha-beta hydrolase superfamily lysophospholipase